MLRVQARAESGQARGGGDHDKSPGGHRFLGRGHQGGGGVGIGQIADDGQHPRGRGIVLEHLRGHPAEGLPGGRVQLPGLLVYRQHGGPGGPQLLGEAADPGGDSRDRLRVPWTGLRSGLEPGAARVVRAVGEIPCRLASIASAGQAGRTGRAGLACRLLRLRQPGQLGRGQRIRVGDEDAFPADVDRPRGPPGEQWAETGDGPHSEQRSRRILRGRAARPGGEADRGHLAAAGREGGHRLPGAGVHEKVSRLVGLGQGLGEADRRDQLIAQQIREAGRGRHVTAGDGGDEPPRGRREREPGEHATHRRHTVCHLRGVQRVPDVQDVGLDARFRCLPGHVVYRVRRAGQDMAAGPVIRRDDQLTARLQGESGVRIGGQADHRGAAGARRGEHGGTLRHERGGVGLGHAARPDEAGDLADAMPEGGDGPHPQAVQPAQPGQRRLDDRGLGPQARPVLPGGGRGRLPGEQQDDSPGGAVCGEQPGTRGQAAGGQVGQQSGGLPGQPGQLLLAGRHGRDPDRAAGGLAAQMAGEVP